MFKKQSDFRVCLHHLAVHVEKFRRAGHIHGEEILLLMFGIFPVVL